MRLILNAILSFSSLQAIAQFGPGGVADSASIGVWLRADEIAAANGAVLDTWFDVSPNMNHAFGLTTARTPTYSATSAMNNMPAVLFDGSNDEMSIADDDALDGTAGLTFYAVVRPTNLNNNPKAILGKRISQSNSAEYAYTWFFWTNNRIFCDLNTQNDRFSTANNVVANNTTFVLGLDFRGSLPAARRARLYSQGVKVTEATESSSVLINSNRDLILGALNTNYGNYFGGDFGELVHFNFSLDSVEHIIIQNHYAAKFGVALTVNDIYDGDTPANGNHDFDVAGIGRVNANAIQNDAQGTGIIRVLNPSNLGNNEFLFWGHDNGNPAAVETTDVPSGVQARLGRQWFFTETNNTGAAVDVGAIDIRFDLRSYPTSSSASDLRLLIDTDGDRSFADESPIAGAVDLGGGIFQFSNVTGIVDETVVTLGTANTFQTPLPVELLSFKAFGIENGVLVQWETASEVNHEKFQLMRSTDAFDWSPIYEVYGDGDANTLKRYSYLDKSPNPINYYQLLQSDYDGGVTSSNVLKVNFQQGVFAQEPYPNPVAGILMVPFPNANETWQVNSIGGVDVSEKVKVVSAGAGWMKLDLESLSNGLYVLQVGPNIYKIKVNHE